MRGNWVMSEGEARGGRRGRGVRRRRAALAVATAGAIFLGPIRARDARAGDGERVRAQARIEALVAANRSAEALPLAVERARASERSTLAWEQVLLLAGWNSDASAAIEALRALVDLRPFSRRYRRDLAQRLLWAGRTGEALEHARRIVRDEEETDPVALEVSTWVLAAEGEAQLARLAAERWAAAAPDEARAHLVVADFTHWTSDWRVARDEYASVLRLAPDAATRTKAEERLELLRREHPTDLRVEGRTWSDSVGVGFFSLAGASTAQLPFLASLRTRVELGRFTEESTSAEGSTAASRALGFARAGGALELELSDVFRPEIVLGAEADELGHRAPVAEVAAGFRAAGRLFARLGFGYDRHRVSLRAAAADVRALGPSLKAYVEPTRWLFAAAEGALSITSDENQRRRGVVAVGVHNQGALQIEPRVFLQYDGYRDARPGAEPYYTPKDPVAYGADATARFSPRRGARLEGSLGVVAQEGAIALRPAASALVEIAGHVDVGASAAYVGSPEYRQLLLDARAGYRF